MSDVELFVPQGPQIVTVPQFDTPQRYWIVPFVDAYLNYYGAIGSDFNSTAGQYLVVGRSESSHQAALCIMSFKSESSLASYVQR